MPTLAEKITGVASHKKRLAAAGLAPEKKKKLSIKEKKKLKKKVRRLKVSSAVNKGRAFTRRLLGKAAQKVQSTKIVKSVKKKLKKK